MARKRMISPEFFTHKLLATAERKKRLPLRVAYAGLWTQADKRGIFKWKPDVLQLAILPYDRCEMSEVLEALADLMIIVRYEIDGASYGIIPRFAKHQTFHKNENPSKDPAPPEGWLSTVLARCSQGASTPVAVTVSGTDAVTVIAPHGEQPVASPDRADSGASALGARSVVKIVEASLGPKQKRRVPPPPGIHAALVGSE